MGKGVIEKILLFVNYKLDPYPAIFGLKRGVFLERGDDCDMIEMHTGQKIEGPGRFFDSIAP